MAMTPAERKRRSRERKKKLDIKPFTMELTRVERQAVADAAKVRGYEDQTEYLLSLVYRDCDKSQRSAIDHE